MPLTAKEKLEARIQSGMIQKRCTGNAKLVVKDDHDLEQDMSGDEKMLGEVTAYISTFGNVDADGDIMNKGCFDKFVKEFNQGDKMLPMLLQIYQNTPYS